MSIAIWPMRPPLCVRQTTAYRSLPRFKKNRVNIEIIDGHREAEIIASTDLYKVVKPDQNYLFVDVGGGSTELTVYSQGQIVVSNPLRSERYVCLRKWWTNQFGIPTSVGLSNTLLVTNKCRCWVLAERLTLCLSFLETVLESPCPMTLSKKSTKPSSR